MHNRKSKDRKFTIAIDFDAVIAKYAGWKGYLTTGKPLKGAAECIGKLKLAGWTIIIHTCRADLENVKDYCKTYKIQYDHINWNPENDNQYLNKQKILADIYLDDRGMTFEGVWDDEFIKKINNFRPYWKK